MKFKNKTLINLKGEALKQGVTPQEQMAPDAADLTAFDVFIQAALMPASVRQYSANESAARYTVCIELYKAIETNKAKGDNAAEVSMDQKLVDWLKDDIVRAYGPLVSGQMIAYIESQ